MINCKPADGDTSTKPGAMIEFEAESMKFRNQKMYEADFFTGDKGPGSVRIEIKPVSTEGVDEEEENLVNKDENWPETPQRQASKPLVDPKIVQDFLLGNYCLFGGTGWWRYEFCYGSKVNQYHEEKGGPKTVINLGRFDLKKHKEWLKENPSKRPKPIQSRKHISHFYSDGDFCEISSTYHFLKRLKSKEMQLCRFVLPLVRQYFFCYNCRQNCSSCGTLFCLLTRNLGSVTKLTKILTHK